MTITAVKYIIRNHREIQQGLIVTIIVRNTQQDRTVAVEQKIILAVQDNRQVQQIQEMILVNRQQVVLRQENQIEILRQRQTQGRVRVSLLLIPHHQENPGRQQHHRKLQAAKVHQVIQEKVPANRQQTNRHHQEHRQAVPVVVQQLHQGQITVLQAAQGNLPALQLLLQAHQAVEVVQEQLLKRKKTIVAVKVALQDQVAVVQAPPQVREAAEDNLFL